VHFLASEDAQDLVEYALLAGFVGIAGWAVLLSFDDAIRGTYQSWIDPNTGAAALWEPGDPIGSGS
jgi:hypothetical protein